MRSIQIKAIEKQTDLIKKRDWDCLVILDACRFDYFVDLYPEYLDGEIRKVESPGSRTVDWIKEIWADGRWNDTVYISGHPFINSKVVEVEGFEPESFYRIIDVWDKAWDEELDTVLPSSVRKFTKLARAKYPGKRLVSHFMQPHRPYLSLGSLDNGASNARDSARGEQKERNMIEKFRRDVRETVRNIFGIKVMRKIAEFLGTRELNEFEMIVERYGEDALRHFYRTNLTLSD